MTRRRRFESGWCEAGTHTKCPEVLRSHRSIVRNGPSGTTIVDLPELRCTCGCHEGRML